MPKTGYKIDYVIRNIGDDLSDLESMHQEVFPNNKLSLWKTDTKVIVKVSNLNKTTGQDLMTAKKKVNYIENINGELFTWRE